MQLLNYLQHMNKICPTLLPHDRFTEQTVDRFVIRMNKLIKDMSKHAVVKNVTTFLRILDHYDGRVGKVWGTRSKGKQKEGMGAA